MGTNVAQVIIVCVAVAAMASCEMVRINHETAITQSNTEVQKLCIEKGGQFSTDWSNHPYCKVK